MVYDICDGTITDIGTVGTRTIMSLHGITTVVSTVEYKLNKLSKYLI